jgi:hypothetical protein
MDLRREVEKLLYWYIPIFLIASFAGSVIGTFLKSMNGMPMWLASLFVWISMFISHLHHFVIAIWLYFLAKKMNQKYMLWTLFGLTAHVLAAIVFLVLYLLDEKKTKSIEKGETVTIVLPDV